MKKIICIISIMMIVLSMPMTALAGSIPEDLLHVDDAQVFFAEVLAYHPNKEYSDIELSPVKVIKGDVKTGVKLTYYNPNAVGNFMVREGNVYLFTYFDEHNPTDIFEVTSYDTSVLKLKNVSGDMWERFEEYLNNGDYEKAEQQRIDRKNETLLKTGETITLTEYLGADLVNTKSSVSIYSGPLAIDVERDKFFKIANEIVLEKIEPAPSDLNGHNIIISLPENMEAVYISSDCKLSRQNTTTSMILPNEYVMKAEDKAKISALIEKEQNLPPMRRVSVVAVVALALAVSLAVRVVIKKKKT